MVIKNFKIILFVLFCFFTFTSDVFALANPILSSSWVTDGRSCDLPPTDTSYSFSTGDDPVFRRNTNFSINIESQIIDGVGAGDSMFFNSTTWTNKVSSTTNYFCSKVSTTTLDGDYFFSQGIGRLPSGLNNGLPLSACGQYTSPINAGQYQIILDIQNNNGISNDCLSGKTIINIQVKPTLSYDANGATSGTVPASEFIDLGDSATVAGKGSLIKNNFDFNVWNTKADGSGIDYGFGSLIPFTSDVDITLYAKWTTSTPTPFNLTYSKNDGSGISSTTERNGGSTFNLSSITTLGFSPPTNTIFDGWSTSTNGVVAYLNSASYTMPYANTTLYAKWTTIIPTTYTLTYDKNGGTGTNLTVERTGGDISSLVSIATLGFSPPINTRFDGWSVTTDGISYYSDGYSSYEMPNATTTLYAKWVPLVQTPYNLTYSKNDGSGISSTTERNGGSTFNLPSTTTLGFSSTTASFSGWSTSANGVVAYSNSAPYTMPNAATTLYAKWTTNPTYTLTYNSNGGSGVSSTTSHVSGSTFNLLSTTTLGFASSTAIFNGWSTSTNGIVAYLNSASYTMPSTTTILYAKWIPLVQTPYNLTYNPNGGTGSNVTESHNGGSAFNLSSINFLGFSSTTASFSGWSTTPSEDASYSDGYVYTMPNAATTLYAKWDNPIIYPEVSLSIDEAPSFTGVIPGVGTTSLEFSVKNVFYGCIFDNNSSYNTHIDIINDKDNHSINDGLQHYGYIITGTTTEDTTYYIKCYGESVNEYNSSFDYVFVPVIDEEPVEYDLTCVSQIDGVDSDKVPTGKQMSWHVSGIQMSGDSDVIYKLDPPMTSSTTNNFNIDSTLSLDIFNNYTYVGKKNFGISIKQFDTSTYKRYIIGSCSTSTLAVPYDEIVDEK
jgi:hypothetical protein